MYRIRLFCNAGMSTSILVNKMQKAAKEQGIEAEIAAYSIREIEKKLDVTDVIMLGPQVSFMKKELIKKCEPYHIPVLDIASMDYGFGNGDKVLKQAIDAIEGNKK